MYCICFTLFFIDSSIAAKVLLIFKFSNDVSVPHIIPLTIGLGSYVRKSLQTSVTFSFI